MRDRITVSFPEFPKSNALSTGAARFQFDIASSTLQTTRLSPPVVAMWEFPWRPLLPPPVTRTSTADHEKRRQDESEADRRQHVGTHRKGTASAVIKAVYH